MWYLAIRLASFAFIALASSSENEENIGNHVCLPQGLSIPGFRANIYSYKYLDRESAYSFDYLQSGYQYSSKLLKQAFGITDPSFRLVHEENGVADGQLYGEDITTTNFTLELVGYFQPSQSGVYTITANEIDDGFSLMMGESAFKCCTSNSFTEQESSDGTVQLTKRDDQSENGEPTTDMHGFYHMGATSVQVELREGMFYPLRLVFANMERTTIMDLSLILPDGTIKN
ncbi:Flocculation protein FLO5 [Lachancea thermotolerans]